MKPKLVKPEERGFVVVVVLCMVILLEVLLLGFNHKSRGNLRAVDDFRRSKQALNCAKAGLNIAIATVKTTDDIDTDKTLKDLFSGQNTFVVGDGECSVIIIEEDGKLNVNMLKGKNGKPDQTRINQLLRLIDLLNREDTGYPAIGYGLVPSIIDWTDSDDEVTYLPFIKNQNLGAESSYYDQLKAPYSCKNRPLDAIEELPMVKGITPQVFERIRDYVTVYGNGEVNINCASKYIIESLSEEMDAALAQVIVDRRKAKPFDSIMELRDVPGVTDSIYNTIKQTATVRPTDRYYHVVSRGAVDQISCTVIAILIRNMKTKNVDVVLYKEV